MRATYGFIFLVFFYSCTERSTDTYNWQQYRGVNAGINLSESDIRDLSELNVNLIRLSFPVRPLMDIEPPHAFNEEAFMYLDSVVSWCEKYDIHVLIDPHKYPGTEHPWTMVGSDPFWKDFKWHEMVVDLWEEIAGRYHDKGDVIAGYDLLNEPEMRYGAIKGSPEDLNLLYSKLIRAIRRHDRKHTIVLALPRSSDAGGKRYPYCDGIKLLEIPEDDNLCIETHTYFPMGFSHQGVLEDIDSMVHYPGMIDGENWDKKTLIQKQELLINFSKESDIPIFLGEFSCPRWTGESGNTYLKDIIDIAEENNWSWAYHSFRESHIWDPEMSNSDRSDRNRCQTTPRLELLKSYFLLNQ